MIQCLIVSIERTGVFACTEIVMGCFLRIACHPVMIGNLSCSCLPSSLATHRGDQCFGNTAMEQATASKAGRFIHQGTQLFMAKIINERELVWIVVLFLMVYRCDRILMAAYFHHKAMIDKFLQGYHRFFFATTAGL